MMATLLLALFLVSSATRAAELSCQNYERCTTVTNTTCVRSEEDCPPCMYLTTTADHDSIPICLEPAMDGQCDPQRQDDGQLLDCHSSQQSQSSSSPQASNDDSEWSTVTVIILSGCGAVIVICIVLLLVSSRKKKNQRPVLDGDHWPLASPPMETLPAPKSPTVVPPLFPAASTPDTPPIKGNFSVWVDHPPSTPRTNTAPVPEYKTRESVRPLGNSIHEWYQYLTY